MEVLQSQKQEDVVQLEGSAVQRALSPYLAMNSGWECVLSSEGKEPFTFSVLIVNKLYLE